MGAAAHENAAVQVRKVDERITEVSASFSAPQGQLFEALTRPDHLRYWMSGDGFTLAKAEVDGRPGGGFKYVYARPSGKLIEVRGAYGTFDPPNGYAYVETYDFSPLSIDVEVRLEKSGDVTRYVQTLTYATAQQRDEDFDGVARSSQETLENLARHLAISEPSPGE
jgi:uncharacterized protein YndB with AHSA1/START domain